jgi:hypothetical protein
MMTSTMRLSLFFYLASAGQSFVAKSAAVLSHPSSSATSSVCNKSHGWKYALQSPSSFLARRAYSKNKVHLEASAVAAAAAAETDTTTTATSSTVIMADAHDFVKPDRDLHDYRYIKLANNLQVLLVSTLGASSAEETGASVEAASIHVQAGHFDDTIPGLAHFHEHMLVRKRKKESSRY